MLPDNLENAKKIVPIGEAARVLGVSIDTIRRWDKAGILHATRQSKSVRYFSLEELNFLKSSKPISIKQAATQLGISISTLRRLDDRGVIKSTRDKNSRRLYTKEALEKYLALDKSAFKSVPISLKIKSPKITTGAKAVVSKRQDYADLSEDAKARMLEEKEKNIETRERLLDIKETIVQNEQILRENGKSIANLWRFSKTILGIFIAIVIFPFIVSLVLAIMLVKFPEQSAIFLNLSYAPDRDNKLSAHVLGASTVDEKKNSRNILSALLKPLMGMSMEMAKQIDPKVYSQIQPAQNIENLNEVLTYDDNGNLILYEKLVIRSSNDLEIANADLLKNLNAEYLNGKTWGNGPGNLVALNDAGNLEISGTIVSSSTGGVLDAPLTLGELVDGSITLVKLADSAVDSSKIVDGSITIDDLADETLDFGNMTIDDESIANSSLENSSITVATGKGLADGGLISLGETLTLNIGSGNGIAVNADTIEISLATFGGSTETASNSGLEVDTNGLSLLKGCSDTQILKWDDASSTWKCAADTTGGGGGSSVWSDLLDPLANLAVGHNEYTSLFDWNTAATANAFDAFTLSLTNDASSDSTTQRLLVLQNASASGGTTDKLLVLENADNSAVTTGIEIVGTSTGAISTAVDLSDAEIATAIALGANDITTSGATLSTSELDILDSGIALSELTDSGTLTVSTADINGGAIDNTAIGSSTRAAGAFTTLSSNSTTSFPTVVLANTTNQLVLGTANTTTISSTAPSASRVYTLPDFGADDTFVGLAAIQTLLNKTFTDSSTIFQDNLDISKKLALQLSTISNSTTRTLTVPNASGTIAVSASAPLALDATTGDISCAGCLATSTTLFTLAGTSGASQTITSGNTVLIEAGNNISTTGGSTDKITVATVADPTFTTVGIGGTTTLDGDITANDSGADTILIGQSGATDDTVTIAGNISLTDDQWALSATGVASGLSGTNTGLVVGDLSCTDCIGPAEITDLTLGTDTAGNYVQSITNGSGISGGNGGSESAALTLALGALTGNWNQTGAFDIVLNNAASELTFLESDGGVSLGTLDVGSLVGDATYTFSGATGTVLTSANYTGTIDSVYVNVGESPATADIAGSFSAGLTINSNAVALGTDTTNDYVASFTAGGGLTGDASGEGSTPTIAVGAGVGITVNANDIAVATGSAFTWTTDHTFTFAGSENLDITSDLDGSSNAISFIGTPSGTAGTTRGIFIQQADSANSNGLDTGIHIDNADGNLALATGIQIANSGGGGYTTLLDTTSLDITGAGAVTGATGITSSGTINFSGLTADRLVVTDGSSNLVSSITSANLALSITNETGSGLVVFGTTPTIASPTITTSPTAAGATWTDLGTVTTADINGGTIDGVTLGGSSAGAGTFTSLTSTDAATLASIIVGGDTINELVGAGLAMSGNSLTASLGTSIAGSEIDANTVDFADIADSASLDADTAIAEAAGRELTVNKTYTDATSENALVINLTASDAGSSTTAQYGLYIENAASTEGADALVFLNNADADDSVADGIRIQSAAGTILTGIDFDDTDIVTDLELQNSETIDNNTDDLLVFSGAGGSANVVLTIDLDGTNAVLFSSTATLDVDDTLNANSITSDAGVSIADANAYTGAGAVTVSSGGASGLTLDSASGTVALNTGDDLSLSGGDITGANTDSIDLAELADATFTFVRNDAGTVIITAADNNTVADFNIAPGTSGTLILGDAATGTNSASAAIFTADWEISATGAITGVAFDANGSGNAISNIETADIANGTLAADDLDQATEDGSPADGECLTFEDSGGGDFKWDACGGGGGGSTWDAIGDAGGDGTIEFASTEQLMNWTDFSDTDFDGMTFNFDNNGGTAGNDYGIVLNNAVSTNAAGDVDTEAVLLVQQLDTTASGTTDVDNLIKIDVAANGGATNGLQITNSAGNLATGILVADTAGGTLTTGLSFTGTFTAIFDIGGTALSGSEVTILDGGVALSELTDSGTLTATTVDINGGAIDGVTIGGASAGAGTFTLLTSTGTIDLSSDAGADTITIGQNGGTDDTVTIAGDISLTDDNWSISGAGAGALVSLSSSGAIAANGGITFNNASDTLGAFTLAGTVDASSNIITNLGATGSSFDTSGGLNLTTDAAGTVLTLDNASNASSILVAEDNNGAVFTIADGGIVTATANINADGGLDVDDAFVIANGGAVSTMTLSDTNVPLTGASFTFDFNNVADRTFTITNSDGTGIANLSVENDVTILGGTLTGANSDAIEIGSANDTVAFTLGGGTEWTFSATLLDSASNLIENIGSTGTDFIAGGGLTLANTLTVTSGGVTITSGALAVNSDSITSDGTLTINASGTIALNDAIITLDAQATDLELIDATSSAFTISETSDNYLAITTTDSSEALTLGNSLTNFSIVIDRGASGSITFSDFTNGGSGCSALETNATGVLTCGTDDGGAGGTLSGSYDSDVDGSNATITLTANDDSIVITNPSSSGTDSTFVVQINQSNTTGGVLVLDLVQSSNAANGANLTANSIDTETGLSVIANALTSGKGIAVASSSTGFAAGALQEITLSGSNAANTGNLLKLSNTGTANTNTSFLIDHRATGTGNLALRVDDEASDTSPFIIDGEGRVGVGTSSITGSTERLLQVGSTTNRGNVAVYGDLVSKGTTDITALTNIKDTYLYDTTADSDGGRWIDWATTDQLSWYTETLDDGPNDACVLATDDRCYRNSFPRKAMLVATLDDLYIFDAGTGDMWMKFSQNASSYALGIATNNDISSVTALNGVIYVTTNGSANGGLYVIDFVNDRMWNIDGTDRSAADVGIASRNSVVTYNSDNTPAFDLSTVGTAAQWEDLNDVSAVYITGSSTAIAIGAATNTSPGSGQTYVGLATDAGVTMLNMTAQKVIQYSDAADNDYTAVALTRRGRMYALNTTLDQLERWNDFDTHKATAVAGTPTVWYDESAIPALWPTVPDLVAGNPDALEVVERGSLAEDISDIIYIGHSLGLTEIHDHSTTATNRATNAWVKYFDTTRQTPLLPSSIDVALMLDDTSGTLADDLATGDNDMTMKGTPTLAASGVRGKGIQLNGTSQYLCSDNNQDGTCDNDTAWNMSTTGWTLSMWFKHSTTIAGNDVLFDKCYNTTPAVTVGCVTIYMTSTGAMVAAIDATTTWTAFTTYDVTATTSLTYNDNQWHNVVLSRTNANDMDVYFDGNPLNLSTATGQTATLDAASQVIAIGADCSVGANCSTGANFWDGAIDDVTFSSGTGTIATFSALQARRFYNDARPLVAKKVITVTDATTATSTTLGDSNEAWIPNELAGMYVTITGNTGVGQSRRIISNTTTTLTVGTAFSTVPDTTSDFEIDPEALYGASNVVSSVGITAENPLGQARQMCIGTDDGSDGGGVTCYNHQAGPNLIAQLFHGDTEETDNYGVEWTGGDYDDIRSIDMSGRALIVASRAHVYLETEDVTLGQGLDYISNQLFNIRGELINDGILLTGSSALEVGFTGGADLAERYVSQEALTAGEIVSLDPSVDHGVLRSKSAYQKDVLGVVATSPGMILGENEENSYPIALVGRVPVKVITQNGQIKAGDRITASDIFGFGMKATFAGRVIGSALEDMKVENQFACPTMDVLPGEICGTVMVFVNLVDYTGDTIEVAMANTTDTLAVDPAFTDTGLHSATAYVSTLAMTSKEAQILDFLAKVKQQRFEAAQAINSQIYTQHVFASEQVISPKIITDLLIAKSIKADSIEGLEIYTDKISSLALAVNQLQQETEQATDSAGSSSDLQVLAAQVTRELQLSDVVFENARVNIDMEVFGDLIANKTLIVVGDATFKGETMFEKLATFISTVVFRGQVSFEKTATFNTDTAGYAVIKSGDKQIQVVFEQEYNTTPVVNVTPVAVQSEGESDEAFETRQTLLVNTDVKFILTQATTKGFTILMADDYDSDTTFTWVALSVKDPKTTLTPNERENEQEKDKEADQTADVVIADPAQVIEDFVPTEETTSSD